MTAINKYAPYGQVTTTVTGQQFFYRWPQPPYLDNAVDCVTVYEKVKGEEECMPQGFATSQMDGKWRVVLEFDSPPDAKILASWLVHKGIAAKSMVTTFPEDFFTHKEAWRKALVMARDSAVIRSPDQDDNTYWTHELNAFDNAYLNISKRIG